MKQGKEDPQKELIQSTMALVRAGYQQAANDVLAYLNDRKVTPDFMDGVMRLLDPENKKAFVYEVFEGELKQLAVEALPVVEQETQRMFTLEEMHRCWQMAMHNGRLRFANRKTFSEYIESIQRKTT